MPGNLKGRQMLQSTHIQVLSSSRTPLLDATKDASDSTHIFISVHTCTNVPSHLQALKLSSWHGSSSISEDHRGSSPTGDIVDLGQPDSWTACHLCSRQPGPDLRPFTMGGCFSKPKPGTSPSLTASPSLSALHQPPK